MGLNELAEPSEINIRFTSNVVSQGYFELLKQEFSTFINELTQYFNLSKLEGVWVTDDLGETLNSIDVGYEEINPRSFTNNDQLVAVAKCVNVMREDGRKIVVIYTVTALAGLLSEESEATKLSGAIVAHELAHVDNAAMIDAYYPGTVLNHVYTSLKESICSGNSMILWNEYHACRATGFIDREVTLGNLKQSFHEHAYLGLRKSQDALDSYQDHLDIPRAVSEVAVAMLEPIRVASYMLGYFDSIDSNESIEDMVNDDVPDFYKCIVLDLHEVLQRMWIDLYHWDPDTIFLPLNQLIDQAIQAGGILLTTQNGQEHARINRFTAPERLP
ncbi:hypothetical protein [Salinicola halophilus]|uniref:hypothetical protein n=1 Tax=Salinicola halophilus TaxID=184065 RepID=UPI000DA1CB9F|nr:hypothetical protein [Salinicola halophilus]